MKMLRGVVIGLALSTGAAAMMMGAGQSFEQASYGQAPQPVQVNPGLPPIDGRKPGDGTAVSPAILEQQARARNNDRQKQLVQDTDKLLELATQLKTEVDKSNKDVLSVDVIKKADEIEKLAKSVKERMKG